MNALRTAIMALTALLATTAHAQDDIQGPGPGDAPGAAKDIGGITFVWCPPGDFSLGSNIPPEEIARQYGGLPEWYADEHPQETITIADGFWISRTEITQAEWTGLANTRPWGEQAPQEDNLPVFGLTWDEATGFAREFGQRHAVAARLPLDSEWEYACRAGSTDVFYFGTDATQLNLHAQFRANTAGGNPQPVAGRGQNAWGLHDILGNVWEWCQDTYTLPGASRANAAGPSFRNVRGGAANSTGTLLRSSYRIALPIETRSPRVGMRLVVAP
jgi:formylglycine-generating enzyme required for sulfatase activity